MNHSESLSATRNSEEERQGVMTTTIQEKPKFRELDLKIRLPENYVNALQELLDSGTWDDPSLNYALNWILYQGLNVNFSGLLLAEGEELERAKAFFDKYGIEEDDQMHASEIMEMAWRKEEASA